MSARVVLRAGALSVDATAMPVAEVPTALLTCDLPTASALARGERNAQSALADGRLRLGGDVRALAALGAIPFVVSLEQRVSAVTEVAHVVLPVAPVAEKIGTFIDWEGRARSFQQALKNANAMTDARVLGMIADAMDVFSGMQTVNELRGEIKIGRAHV